ncbi:hypothetical protein [Burkholderia pyrrocinia]|uniref:hypothetical protein n=1 Tax=Burkholderia pyrrocinia TaxID=60550 RepID=UPI00158BD57E|nr:hypothetical protein [Burkholderia pyrrocinia]
MAYEQYFDFPDSIRDVTAQICASNERRLKGGGAGKPLPDHIQTLMHMAHPPGDSDPKLIFFTMWAEPWGNSHVFAEMNTFELSGSYNSKMKTQIDRIFAAARTSFDDLALSGDLFGQLAQPVMWESATNSFDVYELLSLIGENVEGHWGNGFLYSRSVYYVYMWYLYSHYLHGYKDDPINGFERFFCSYLWERNVDPKDANWRIVNFEDARYVLSNLPRMRFG